MRIGPSVEYLYIYRSIFIRRSSLFFLVVGMEAQEQRKIMRKKCPRCRRIEGSQWIPKREVPIAMSRLYVKRKVSGKFQWFSVGWVCLRCGYVEIEHFQLPKVKTYKSPITTDWGVEPVEPTESMETCPTCGAKLEEGEKEEVALRWKATVEAYKEALKKPGTLGTLDLE
jgi:Zn-finger nucleic acid-binding protein